MRSRSTLPLVVLVALTFFTIIRYRMTQVGPILAPLEPAQLALEGTRAEAIQSLYGTLRFSPGLDASSVSDTFRRYR